MTARVATDTAAVVVTHDGERWLVELFDSIAAQSILPSVVVVVDDSSGDGTRAIVREVAAGFPVPVELVPTDGSGAPDVKTRVSRNFALGMVAASPADVMVLSDQDDTWLPNRVARQRARLGVGVLLTAGDGVLVDDRGDATGARLRDRFPAPPGWPCGDAGERVRGLLARPCVTGSATAVHRGLIDDGLPVPPGWLHDRWLSLVAVARDGLDLDPEAVIRYRVHLRQVLGDRQSDVDGGRRRWRQVHTRGAGPGGLLRRTITLRQRVRPVARDDVLRAQLSWASLVRAGLTRT